MPIGWNNGLPFRVGGGPTLEDRLFAELVQAFGYGLVPDDIEESIEGLFLIGMAKALAAAASFDEAAATQVFPGLATDAIADYEQILQLAIESVDEEDRRRAVEEQWTWIPPTTMPLISERLLEIDPRFDLLDVTWLESATTHFGRTMQGQSGEDAFGGGRTATNVPAFSNADVVYVFLDVGAGPLSDSARSAYERGRRLLHDSIPAWMDYQIATDTDFILDLSVLDGTMFGGLSGTLPEADFLTEEDESTPILEEDGLEGVTDE